MQLATDIATDTVERDVADTVDHEVVVIGAGFSGIGAAIKLDQAGFNDFVVLEEGDGVGGAWHWNTYPGSPSTSPPSATSSPSRSAATGRACTHRDAS